MISKKWKIPQEIYDLHIGQRSDIREEIVKVGQVFFHIPFLTNDNVFVLWSCLWPDCHNCCNRQTGLPITMDDIKTVSKKIGSHGIIDFIKNETLISTRQNAEIFGQTNTIRTQLFLKRKTDETESESTSIIPCRFLDEKGCSIHPDKPSVCWMYPFASYLEFDANSRLTLHAKFQFTGDCPGFYLDKSIDSMMSILKEYSTRIFHHNMASFRAKRQGYAAASSVRLGTL